MKKLTKQLLLNVVIAMVIAFTSLGLCFGNVNKSYAEETVQPDYSIKTLSQEVLYQGHKNVYVLTGDYSEGKLYRSYYNHSAAWKWWQGYGSYTNFMFYNNSTNFLNPNGADMIMAYVIPCFADVNLYGRICKNIPAESTTSVDAKIVLRTEAGDTELVSQTVTGAISDAGITMESKTLSLKPGDVIYFIAEALTSTDADAAWQGVIFDCSVDVFKKGGYVENPTSLLGATQMPMTGSHNITVTNNVVDSQPILSENMKLDQTNAMQYCYKYPDSVPGAPLSLFVYQEGEYVIPGGGNFSATSTGVQEHRVFYSNNGWCGAAGMIYYAPAAGKISILGKAVVNAQATATVYTFKDQTPTVVKALPTGEVDFASVSEINNVNIVANDAMVILFDAPAWASSSMACAFEFYADPVLDKGENVKVNAITIEGEGVVDGKITVTEGDTVTLKATVAPENAINKDYTWASEDETVATVENGVVTTLKAGVVKITATANDGSSVSAEVEITVNAKQTISESDNGCVGSVSMQTVFAVLTVLAVTVILKRKMVKE